MDKFYFVIGYTSKWGRHDGSAHLTEIIFVEDGEPLIVALKAIIKRDRCLDYATSQFHENYLDDHLVKLHPDGRQEKILIKTRKVTPITHSTRNPRGSFRSRYYHMT